MESVSKLRDEVSGLDRQYRGQRYPAELRARLVAAARGLRGRGWSWHRVASELGVRDVTLRRWCEGAPKRRAARTREDVALVPVELVGGTASTVAVVAPSGWRVEGLSLGDAVTLLRSAM